MGRTVTAIIFKKRKSITIKFDVALCGEVVMGIVDIVGAMSGHLFDHPWLNGRAQRDVLIKTHVVFLLNMPTKFYEALRFFALRMVKIIII